MLIESEHIWWYVCYHGHHHTFGTMINWEFSTIRYYNSRKQVYLFVVSLAESFW